LLRFFSGTRKTRAGSPWASSLSGGTRISSALLFARDALRRAGVANGSAVLVSDLGDSPNDRTALAAAVVTYLRDGIPLKVIGIHPAREDAAFFTRLLGSRPLEPRTDQGPARTAPSSPDVLQIGLLVAAAVFLLLLAANEHFCAGLSWNRETVA
jgi:hypothetical protein